MTQSVRKHFGEPAAEDELRVLGDQYPSYYFDHTQFSGPITEPRRYLIVGRRGSGKTSLARYLKFQKRLPAQHYIDVDEPVEYDRVMRQAARRQTEHNHFMTSAWEYVIWSLMFEELDKSGVIEIDSSLIHHERASWARAVRTILKAMLAKFTSDKFDIVEALEDAKRAPLFEQTRLNALEYFKRNPIFVVFDTLERYDVHDSEAAAATAALVQCASKMNSAYSSSGVHIKVFISKEFYPYLVSQGVDNVAKHVRDELILHWRPRDLQRLASWRFWKYLTDAGSQMIANQPRWDDHSSVRDFWSQYFGPQIRNSNGHLEDSFAYLIRHTQMLPRQVVMLCNSIADEADRLGKFPEFYDVGIPDVVASSAKKLADDILNAYSKIHPRIVEIVECLEGQPSFFPAGELDQIAAQRAKKIWQDRYDRQRFKRVLAEIGVIGVVRKVVEPHGIIHGDFEYHSNERLSIHENQSVVIHPMWYRRLKITRQPGWNIYPFPDTDDYRALIDPSRSSRR